MHLHKWPAMCTESRASSLEYLLHGHSWQTGQLPQNYIQLAHVEMTHMARKPHREYHISAKIYDTSPSNSWFTKFPFLAETFRSLNSPVQCQSKGKGVPGVSCDLDIKAFRVHLHIIIEEAGYPYAFCIIAMVVKIRY